MSNASYCAAAEGGNIAHNTKGGCDFCQTQGVPILPVRYAVHLNPEQQSSVKVPLPVAPTPAGYPTLTAHHYTLRLLRSGYLYVFDQAQARLAAWRIAPDAKFQQFALDATDHNGVPDVVRKSSRADEKPAPFSCKNKANHVPAAMIHWPTKGSTTLWLYYSELPVPKKALLAQTHDTAWREAHMQRLDINAPSGAQVFPSTRIPELLAERHSSRTSVFEPHPYHRDLALGNDIGTAFADYMAQHQTRTGERGVMLALKDDIGVLEALNYNRHLPEQAFNAQVGHAPGKDDAQCTATELEVRRKLQSYNVFNMLLNNKRAEGDAENQRYQALYATSSGRYTLAEEAVRAGGGDPSIPFSTLMAERHLATPEQHAKQVQSNVEHKLTKVESNFLEHVNVASFQAFKGMFEAAVKRRDQQLTALDKDYTAWLITRAPALLQAVRWMKDYPVLASSFMPVLLRGLTGNVMTEHSFRLWHEHLLKRDATSLLVSALGLQDPAMIQQLNAKLTPDENSFITEMLKAKNLVKLSKEFNTFIAKCCKSLTDETIFALLSRPPKLSKPTLPSIASLHEAWMPLLTRVKNLCRRLRGESVLHVVELAMPASDHHNFIRSLPKALSTFFEPREMRSVATLKNQDGTTQVRHQPYSQTTAQPGEPLVKMYLLVEHADLRTLKQVEHGGERLCSARLVATGESFTLHPAQGRQLQYAFANIVKQDKQQLAHGTLALLFAMHSLYTALQKRNDNLEEMVSLVSSLLGFTKGVVALMDTTRKALVASHEVNELRLIGDMRWATIVTHTSNVLGVVTAGFELIKALEAQRNGEPERVVNAMLFNAGLSVTTAVLGFASLGMWPGLVIGVVAVILGALFAELSSQALTLAQRLWVHRGVFGLHQRAYYDSEPFGGPMPAGKDALKSYHSKALLEEMDALAMLVRGITLTVHVMPSTLNVDRYFPEYRRVQQANAPRQNPPRAFFTLSIPAKVDGFIRLKLTSSNGLNDNPAGNVNGTTELEYKKVGKKITDVNRSKAVSIVSKFNSPDDLCELNFSINIEKINYRMVFSLSTFEEQYIPVAQDRISFKG